MQSFTAIRPVLLVRQPNLSTPEWFSDRTILETFYSCALRISELRKLTVYDIDIMGGTLIVLDGKGKKDRIGTIHSTCDEKAHFTLSGYLPFFSEFFHVGGIFEDWVSDCPLEYKSNNAHEVADILGTST